jgi:hypothetical protein
VECFDKSDDMTKDEFITAYCERSDITRQWYNTYYIALPCTCGDSMCDGWGTVRNRPEDITHHLFFFGPEESRPSSPFVS